MKAEDFTRERIAANQSVFHEANERIELAAERIGLFGRIPYICECPQPTCMDLIPMRIDGYEELRDNPRLFVTAPGHEQLAVDAGAGVVVGKRDTYAIVEMIGLAGELAEDNYREINGDQLSPPE